MLVKTSHSKFQHKHEDFGNPQTHESFLMWTQELEVFGKAHEKALFSVWNKKIKGF